MLKNIPTEGKLTPFAIEQAKTRLVMEAALNSMKDAVFIADAEGAVVHFNKAFATFHKFKSTAECSAAFNDFPNIFEAFSLNGDILPIEKWPVSLAIQGKSGENHEIQIRRQDTGECWIGSYTYSQILNVEGRIAGSVSSIRDITEQKKLLTELEMHRNHLVVLVEERTRELTKAKTESEAANLAKSLFLANMSHELRTPLAGVIGMTDLALGRAMDSQQVDWLNKSKRSALHLMSVINDILDISKIEAGNLTLEDRNFSVSNVLGDAIFMLGDAARGKSLPLTLELDPAAPDLLCGDALRLKQVALNYLNNAVKFSKHGSVKLRTQLIEQNEHGVMLRIEVTDQGIGISADQQARLFQSFTQADDSTTRKFGGTGLGLFICRRIARLMGGDTGVISHEGQGSTFWATVRFRNATLEGRSDSQARELSPRDLLMQRFNGRLVLLAEDDEVNQEIGVLMLEAAGLVVEVASNGKDAVRKAESGSYAVILMDVQMPVMNGLEATRAIRLLPGLQGIPIVAMSANAFSEDRERSLDAGMNDHIGKPVLPDLLYSTLLRWMA